MFLDVVESVNLLVNANGSVVRSEVTGALKFRTYLSGMPECKLGLNDRVLLESQGRNAKVSKHVKFTIKKPRALFLLSREQGGERVELRPRGASCEPNHRFYGPVMEGWEAALES